MAKKKDSLSTVFTRGILKENPVFVLLLGTCPFLAVTTSVSNGLGIGLATMFVLLCTNTVIAALKGIISDKVRIPVFIIIISGFVTIVQLLIKAFIPALDQSLGIFIPLITVNCIVLGRAEAYASKNGVGRSIVDALGMGIGFTLACIAMGATREVLGNGTILDMPIPWLVDNPVLIFILPSGGFFVYAILIMLSTKLNHYFDNRKQALEKAAVDRYVASQTETAGAASVTSCESDSSACNTCKTDGCGMDEFRKIIRPSRPDYQPAQKAPKHEEGRLNLSEGGELA